MTARSSLRLLQRWAALRPGALQSCLLRETTGPRQESVLPSLRTLVRSAAAFSGQPRRGLATEAATQAASPPAAVAASPSEVAVSAPSKARRRRSRSKAAASPAAGVDPQPASKTALAAHSSLEALQTAPVATLPPALPPRLLEDDAHPIREGHISAPAWSVLARLRSAGHEAYVVGGTVRDILLQGIPKDYDILTTADPHAVTRLFPKAMVLGRSFPVCHVHVGGTVVEVSSFGTKADASLIPGDAAAHVGGRGNKAERRHKDKKGKRSGGGGGGAEDASIAAAEGGEADGLLIAKKEELLITKREALTGPTWAAARRDNAQKRDFTVNALIYDPFTRTIYDYVGGVADCTLRTLRTITPPAASFRQDPARILRGVRLAARAGLEVEGATAEVMAAQAGAIAVLPQGRLSMEVAAMLGHGAAAPSVELMWRLGLLHLLLPHHALYLKRERIPRHPAALSGRSIGGKRTVLLLELLAELDRHVNPQRPVNPAAWVALLAAPLVALDCAAAAERRATARKRAAALKQQAEEAAAAGAEARVGAAGAEEGDSSGWSLAALRSWVAKFADVAAPEQPVVLLSASSASGALLKGGAAVGSAAGEDNAGRSAAAADVAASEDDGGGGESWQYLEEYRQIVDAVMLRMLSPMDAKSQRALWLTSAERSRAAQPVGDAADNGAGAGSAGGTDDGRSRHSMAALPCVLSKAAAEQAAELLLLEAELRGGELPPIGAAAEGGDSAGPSGSKVGKWRQRQRHQRLREEYRLALQTLRRPEFRWAELTSLGME